MEYVNDQTLLIAMSDHGFNSFRRGVHLNSWLHENGLLKLKDGVEPGEAAGDLLRQVDWSRTKAYALGLSGLYLNLKGREEQGIVPPEDAEGLKHRSPPAWPAWPTRSVATAFRSVACGRGPPRLGAQAT